MKSDLKRKAIRLRKEGLSYSEILKQVPVAKSTLSLWLRSVGLSKRQKQRLTEKKLASMRQGAARKREIRLEKIKAIRKEAKKDVKNLSKEHLWLSGVMLYWAEGTKEKNNSIGTGVQFGNSDPRMIKLFVRWLTEVIKIPKESLVFEIYIHRTGNVEKALNWWSNIVPCEKDKFKVYFKKHNLKLTNRRNTGENYHGLLRVKVRKSSTLNRKIAAWVSAICEYWGIV